MNLAQDTAPGEALPPLELLDEQAGGVEPAEDPEARQEPARPHRKRSKRNGGGAWNDYVRRRQRERAEAPSQEGFATSDGGAISDATALILNMEQSADSCRPHSGISVCGCKYTLGVHGCNKADCATCAGAVGKRRGERVFRRVMACLAAVQGRHPEVRDPRLWTLRAWTFTVPPELRGLFLTAEGVTRARKALAELMAGAYGAAWSCIIPHPVGDRDKDCATFHPHFNVLWSTGGPSRAFLDRERFAHELDAVRRRWRGVLWALAHPAPSGRREAAAARRVAVELDQVEQLPLPVVYMGAKRADQAGGIRHACDYNARIFAGWRRWAPKWISWYGAPEKTPARLAQTCDCCGQKTTLKVSGWEECRAELAHMSAHQETGPPLDEVLDGFWEVTEAGRRWTPPRLELPGDRVELPFLHFSAELLVDVLGLPLHEVVAHLDYVASRAAALAKLRELVAPAASA